MTGKIWGAIAGFWLGGPFGAIIGATVAHYVGKAIKDVSSQATREEIIEFLVLSMAKVASIDGRVSEEEIAQVESLFKELNLSKEERLKLINIFRNAKSNDVDLLDALSAYMQNHPDFMRDTNRKANYINLLVQVALSDGHFSENEEILLSRISEYLGLLDYFRSNFSNSTQGNYQRNSQSNTSANNYNSMTRREALLVLGLNANATKEEIKKAFKAKARDLHPDTLQAKNVPNTVIKLAQEEFIRVKEAYDYLIK
ncbi:MAG: TerB family tellurite resistance protein [Opitutales bacterium]